MASDLNPASAEALTENAKLNKVSLLSHSLKRGLSTDPLRSENRLNQPFERRTKMRETLFELQFYPSGTLHSLPTSRLSRQKNETDEIEKLEGSLLLPLPRLLPPLLLLLPLNHRPLVLDDD